MSIAMIGFLLNDTVVKLLSQDIGTGQLILVRGLFATGLLFILCKQRAAFRPPSLVLHPVFSLRIITEMLSTLTLLTALAFLPLSSVAAILQALPLIVTLGAALFLGEAIGWRRVLAILTGLCGVLLIIQPGFGDFNFYSLLVLLSVFTTAGRDLSSRRLDRSIPSLFISFVASVAITLMGAVMTIFSGWTDMDLNQIFWCFLASIFIIIGYFFVTAAMRVGETGFVTPFRYTVLVWALIMGYFVFDEVPDSFMITGSIIVVTTGLYSLHRERILSKKQMKSENLDKA